MKKAPFFAALVIASVSAAAPARAQNFMVQLKKAWAQEFADRATINAKMVVHHAHKSPNAIGSGGEDGDMHFSGESADVGLPFVAEIVNAALPGDKPAVDAMKAKAGSTSTLDIVGAWRLWFEHPSASQTQGAKNPFSPDNTNPDHSFEIHPVSSVDQNGLSASFVPIKGYTAYTADVAFTYFSTCALTVKASQSGITLRSKKLKYNYVGFAVELTQEPKKVSDGYIALAKILSGTGGEQVVDDIVRLIFVGGTDAADKIKGASHGDRFQLLGIPRVNLNAVLALAEKHKVNEQFDAALPYEMIIVGVK